MCLYSSVPSAEATSDKPTWNAIHQQGRFAYDRHDYRTSEQISLESAAQARTAFQRGIATNGLADALRGPGDYDVAGIAHERA